VSITRDTRPVDPVQQAQREKLDGLAQELRQLHTALLDIVKADFEKLNGKTKGPFHMFQLVTQDPFFQWLRPLSGMMSTLDESIDEKRLLLPDEIQQLRDGITHLLRQDDPMGFGENLETRAMDNKDIARRRNDIKQAVATLQ
jgi:hypothetical protein